MPARAPAAQSMLSLILDMGHNVHVDSTGDAG